MARRPTPRTNLNLERLESREVLSSGGPTGEMQAMLELTNFARQHPSEAANWAFSDLQTDNLGVTLQAYKVDVNRAKSDIASKTVAQPLAWNDQLASAANTLSRFQAQTGVQSHTGGGTLSDGTVVGVSLDDRISNAHYNNSTARGENAFAYATSVQNAMKAFLIDWGNDPSVKPHLTNVFKPEYREAGFAVVDSTKGLGPKVVTQVFGAQANAKPMLVGVVYDDSVQADHFYQAGEGRGDVSIDVIDASGHTQTVQTWDAGGYQIALDPGHYTVRARIGDKVIRTQGIDVNNQNVKVDFNLADAWEGTVLTPPVVAVPTPKPTPVVVAPKADPAPESPKPTVVIQIATPKVALPVVIVSSTPKPTTPAPSIVAATPTPTPKPTPAGTIVAPSTTVDPLNAFQGLMWESW